jgi:type I restriction enzyme S subunit
MNWRTTTLGELCDEGGGSIQTGPFGSQLHAADYVAHGIPSVMPQNIGDNVIDPDGIARIADADAMRLAKYLLASGDIVYSRRGDVERRAFVRPENDGWLCGTGCLRVRLGPASSHDSLFLSYYLGTEDARAWIVRHAVGATMANLNTGILAAVPVRVPEPHVQTAIAEVLGALDDKIAANAGLATAVDDLLGALFDRLSSAAPWGCLQGIAHVNRASTKPQAGGTLRYLDIASVGTGNYELPEPIAWGEAPGRARRILGRGDTVWSTVRPNRRSHALVLDRSSRLVASTGLAVLTPRSDDFAFVYEATRTKKFLAFLEAAAEGSAYPAVRAERFLDAPVPRVADADRLVFERVAAPLRERVHAATAESRTLTKLRDALLPQLMSGKIRVKDAEGVVEGVI